jgi:hypothetical protein
VDSEAVDVAAGLQVGEDREADVARAVGLVVVGMEEDVAVDAALVGDVVVERVLMKDLRLRSAVSFDLLLFVWVHLLECALRGFTVDGEFCWGTIAILLPTGQFYHTVSARGHMLFVCMH